MHNHLLLLVSYAYTDGSPPILKYAIFPSTAADPRIPLGNFTGRSWAFIIWSFSRICWSFSWSCCLSSWFSPSLSWSCHWSFWFSSPLSWNCLWSFWISSARASVSAWHEKKTKGAAHFVEAGSDSLIVPQQSIYIYILSSPLSTSCTTHAMQNFWKITFFYEFHRFNCTCENFIPGKFTLELVVHVGRLNRDRLMISTPASCCALACYCMPIITVLVFTLDIGQWAAEDWVMSTICY